jgi:hypothetical protein
MTQPALTAARYRNKGEASVGEQLSIAGVPFEYEGAKVPFTVPKRTALYWPDFRVGDIILEYKGWWGRQGGKERKKYCLVRESNPHLDIRFIFTNANKRITKESDTTYGEWADEHGFQWSDKGIVPAEWIEDLREESKRCRRNSR